LLDLNVNQTKLKIVGSYPVASGTYPPEYYILNPSDFTDRLVPDKIGLGIINPRFDIENHDSIMLRGQYIGRALTTQAQAKAWFESVEGKTVLKILQSTHLK